MDIYGLIISLEENTLIDIFGDDYKKYKENVPRLFSRFTSWQPNKTINKVPWGRVFRAERSPLINQTTFLTIILLKEILINRLHVI
jgi:hypothetical protein